MADIALVASEIGVVFQQDAKFRNRKCGVAVTKGQAVYVVAATGLLALADASAAGTAQFDGIALEAGAIGQVITVVQGGEMEGFTITGLDFDALAFLSNTAGALADAAGAVTVPVGRVVPITDPTPTKVLEIVPRPAALWA